MADNQTENAATPELVAPAPIRKPDRIKVKASEDKIKAEMEVNKARINAISDEIKAKQSQSGGDPAATHRVKLKELMAEKSKLMAQKKELNAARDAARESREAKLAEVKDLKEKAGGKVKTVGEIDKQIAKLEHQQSTTSMTLAKEKEILAEIAELKKQRKVAVQTSAASASVDDGKAAAVDTALALKDVNQKLDAIKPEVEKLQALIAKLSDDKKDSPVKKLIDERTELRAQNDAKIKEIQKLWDDFKKEFEAWKDNQTKWDEYKKAKDAKDAEERAAKDAEKAAKRAEELAKKVPYEEEMELCDYLLAHLGQFVTEAKAAAVETELLTEFNGLALTASKKRDGDVYLALKGKKEAKATDLGKKNAKRKFILHSDTLDSFSLVHIEPPTSYEAVPAVIEALKAKKEEFKVMPRGQIVSIAELNQKAEAEAETRRSNDREAKASKDKKPANPKKIDAASQELFPSLKA